MSCLYLFVFVVPAVTVGYALSLHDALPIWPRVDPRAGEELRHRPAGGRGAVPGRAGRDERAAQRDLGEAHDPRQDRKSTRLNSSHVSSSYAVFCLKKKTYY